MIARVFDVLARWPRNKEPVADAEMHPNWLAESSNSNDVKGRK